MKGHASKLVGAVAIPISLTTLLFSGCIHITHPSNVRPGWSAEVVGGAGKEHYRADSKCNNCRGGEPATGDVKIIQTNLAWGKKLEGGRILRTGLMIPLSMNNGSMLGALGGATLDIYYQFLKGPINASAPPQAPHADNSSHYPFGYYFDNRLSQLRALDAAAPIPLAWAHADGASLSQRPRRVSGGGDQTSACPVDHLDDAYFSSNRLNRALSRSRFHRKSISRNAEEIHEGRDRSSSISSRAASCSPRIV
jgi:hypothetical protein